MKQIYAIEIIKKVSQTLFILWAMLLVAACSQHDDGYELPPAPMEPNVTFEVRIPKANTPSTYALTTEQENALYQATVLAYKSVNGTELLIEKIPIEAANITNDVIGNAKIKVVIPAGEYHRLVLITNTNTQVATLALNSTLAELNSLERAHDTGKWHNYIPMSGELVAGSLNGIEIKGGVPRVFNNIKLTRMLAKIDVRSTDENFTLNTVYLYNMNRNGLIMKNGNYSATPAKPNLPGTLQKATSPITHYVRDNVLNNAIYACESAAPTAATLGTTSPRIILRGSGYNYYPIDFTYPGDKTGTTKGKFMPIVRNHQYIFTVTKVNGKGFDTAEEALACTDVFTNIEVKVVAIDDDFTDVYHDRHNFLAVNTSYTSIVMGKAAYDAKKEENTITVLTDADSFTIECYNKDDSPTTRIKPDQVSYSGGTKTDAYLIANYVTTEVKSTEFEGYIIIKAGELQSEKIPVYKVWCGIEGVPMINTVGNNVYKTHYYPTSTSGTMECWMVENSIEGVSSSIGYGLDASGNDIGRTYPSGARGQVNGYYYTWEQRDNACPTGWAVPTSDQWDKLVDCVRFVGIHWPDKTSYTWWGGERGAFNSAFAGTANGNGGLFSRWNASGQWWSSSTMYEAYYGNSTNSLTGPETMGPDGDWWLTVRCVKK